MIRSKLKKADWDSRFQLKLISAASSLPTEAEGGKIQTR